METIKVKKSSKKKYFFILLFVIVLIGALAAGGAYLWYTNTINTPASANSESLTLRVVAGETLLDIAPKIQKAGGLKSLEALKVYMRLNNVNVQLQVGTYIIPLNRNVPDLITELNNGPELLSVSVTIREGLRADEIADTLAIAFKDVKRPAFNRDEFMTVVNDPDNHEFSTDVEQFLSAYKPAGKTLEGFLFPDTYNIGIDASSSDVAGLLIKNLIARLDQNKINPANTGSIDSFYTVLNYASIVEKEAFDFPEKKMVADIFIRRVNEGLGLGSDATILYPYHRWNPPPTAAELAEDTPYNSRIHINLPPSPIANPGIDSIKAVLNPTPNDYYYFLHGQNTDIYYARTLAEHYQNIANHL